MTECCHDCRKKAERIRDLEQSFDEMRLGLREEYEADLAELIVKRDEAYKRHSDLARVLATEQRKNRRLRTALISLRANAYLALEEEQD